MAGRVAGLVGIGGIGAALFTVGREFIGFDQAITSASAKFSDLNLATAEGQRQLEALQRVAREVGATTKFSATEAAEGLDFLAMAGFNSAQAMAALPGVTALATVAQTDLATATDIASDALGAFGLMTDDTAQLEENFTRVNDVMAQTMSSTNTNIEALFESVKSGAPTFIAAGQTMETFSALVGVLANNSVKGSEAGTSLRNVMLKLANPTAEAADLIKELGVETADEAGNFRDVIDILADFEAGLEGMGTQQRSAAIATIFGARTVTGINLLLQEGSDSLREFRGELIDAGGASRRMADIIEGSLGNKLAGLRSAALEAGFKFVSAFKDQAAGAITALTDRLRTANIQGLVDGIVRGVQIFKRIWQTGIIQSVLAGIVAFKTLTTIIAAYKAVMAAAQAVQLLLNGAMAANPIGLIIVAIAALVAGIVLLIKHWDVVRDFMGRVWDRMKAFASWIGRGFLAAFAAVGDFFSNLFGNIQSIVERIVGWITGVVQGIGEAIGWVVNLFDREARRERQSGRRSRREERRAARRGDTGDDQDMLISPNEAVITSQTLSEQRSTVDVNLNSLPAGTSVRQTGQAPGVNIRTGFAEAAL